LEELVEEDSYNAECVTDNCNKLFSDWASGFVAIRKDIFNNFNLIGDHGEYFMYLVHHLIKSECPVLEVPYVL